MKLQVEKGRTKRGSILTALNAPKASKAPPTKWLPFVPLKPLDTQNHTNARMANSQHVAVRNYA